MQPFFFLVAALLAFATSFWPMDVVAQLGSKFVSDLPTCSPSAKKHNCFGVTNFDGKYRGHKYEGEFKNGMFGGLGVYSWPNGDRYFGDFKDDLKHGWGVLSFAGSRQKGEYYVGEFRDDLFNGIGTYVFSSGERQMGEYVDGKMNGFAINLLGGDFKGHIYIGQYKNSARTGTGVYKYNNGSIYSGDYVDNKMTGFGLLFHGGGGHEGEYYVGKFERGHLQGAGTYIFPDNKIQKGYFRNSKLIRTYNIDEVLENYTLACEPNKFKNDCLGVENYDGGYQGYRYVGEFYNGKIHGEGVTVFENGDMYVGRLKDGLRDGAGTYIFHSGAVYRGHYSQGIAEGYGIQFGSGDYVGHIYKGTFSDGQFKEGTYIYPTGEKKVGRWYENKFQHGGTSVNDSIREHQGVAIERILRTVKTADVGGAETLSLGSYEGWNVRVDPVVDSSCLMLASYEDGTSFRLQYFKEKNLWTLEISHLYWEEFDGESHKFRYQFNGERPVFLNLFSAGVNKRSLKLVLPESFIENFKNKKFLDVSLNNLIGSFSLQGTNNALAKVLACVSSIDLARSSINNEEKKLISKEIEISDEDKVEVRKQKELVASVKRMLFNLGYMVGPGDYLDDVTSAAILAFKIEKMIIPVNSEITKEILTQMQFYLAERNTSVDYSQMSLSSTGSGFYIGSAGHVVSNYHVVDGCDFITDRENNLLKILEADKENDLIIGKLDSKLTYRGLKISDDDPSLGENVFVAGFPLNDFVGGLNFTSGIVSAEIGLNQNGMQFQMTAPIQPGNSGGPILSEKGSVLGISVSSFNTSAEATELLGSVPQNMNYGIKKTVLTNLLDRADIDFDEGDDLWLSSKTKVAKIAKDGTILLKCWAKTE